MHGLRGLFTCNIPDSGKVQLHFTSLRTITNFIFDNFLVLIFIASNYFLGSKRFRIQLEIQHLSRFSGFSASIGLSGEAEKGYNPVANISGHIGTRILTLGANLAYDLSASSSAKITNNLNAGLSLNSPYLVAAATL